MDRVSISCERLSDLPGHLALARSRRIGLELQEFSNPLLLDDDWRGLLRTYQSHLDGFESPLTMHGAFIDLISGSPDRRVAAIARDRYRQNLDIAHTLGAQVIDFHANYLPLVDHPSYLPDWENRQVDFWTPLAEEAAQANVTLVLENMWEPDPRIICRVLTRIGSPYLKACLDVGHASLYSRLPVSAWIDELGAEIIYTHLHNNHGTTDEHLAFGDGVLDFPELLATLRGLSQPPMFILELPNLSSIEASLPYLDLA
ncbi:MAG TPA: sugar phosphate isomerase/epimerase family protein [Anaerolineae bacterium]|nr:sugar phosphate isomerase/epimerase family protein [Anaerolineae bacterium]